MGSIGMGLRMAAFGRRSSAKNYWHVPYVWQLAGYPQPAYRAFLLHGRAKIEANAYNLERWIFRPRTNLAAVENREAVLYNYCLRFMP